MKRLYQLTPEDIDAWRKARLEDGQRKYKDGHLQRYGMVDVLEELLDAANILWLSFERTQKHLPAYEALRDKLAESMDAAIVLDEKLDDDDCTDEKGGERIWWDDQSSE